MRCQIQRQLLKARLSAASQSWRTASRTTSCENKGAQYATPWSLIVIVIVIVIVVVVVMLLMRHGS